jgi:hypothetical protein
MLMATGAIVHYELPESSAFVLVSAWILFKFL